MAAIIEKVKKARFYGAFREIGKLYFNVRQQEKGESSAKTVQKNNSDELWHRVHRSLPSPALDLHYLYQMALMMVATNAEMKQLYDYLKTREKAPLRKMQALVVISKKILTLIHTLAKDFRKAI